MFKKSEIMFNGNVINSHLAITINDYYQFSRSERLIEAIKLNVDLNP